MSTTASNVEELLRRAASVVENGDNEIDTSLVRDLAAKLREYHPIVHPKLPVVENPNITEWRPNITRGLNHAIESLKMTLKTQEVTATTHIRRSVMKDGGIKARLGIKCLIKAPYTRGVEPTKVMQSVINAHLAADGLPPVAIVTTSGSQMYFNARVYLEGDEDYDYYAKWWIK